MTAGELSIGILEAHGKIPIEIELIKLPFGCVQACVY